MTARDDALAALEWIRSQVVDQGASLAASLDPHFALVRAALAPELPADLAEIQSRLDNFGQITCPRCKGTSWDPSGYGDACSDCDGQGEVNSDTSLALVEIGKALVAELAELRARPTLTAEDADLAVHLMITGNAPRAEALRTKLRAIAEGAGL